VLNYYTIPLGEKGGKRRRREKRREEEDIGGRRMTCVSRSHSTQHSLDLFLSCLKISGTEERKKRKERERGV